jgi:nucleoid-associated protein YgaU
MVAGGQLEQLREEAAKATVLLKGLFVDGKSPAKDQLAAATSACEIAFKALASFKPAPDAGVDVAAAASKASKSATEVLKLLDDAGDDPAKVGAAIASIEAAAKGAMPDVAKPSTESVKPETPQTNTPSAPAQPMAEAKPAAGSQQQASGGGEAGNANEPKSVEQAPLKESKNTVIIRKGDTLWQISRRVYGRGVRYTTIYLANEDQITNPNLITPGQVFGVPDKTLQSDAEAEKANRKFQTK